MLDYVQVRLENDFIWEPFFKSSQFNEDAVKEFCKTHPEYYTRRVELDKYCELRIDVKDKNGKISKYDVYIDEFYSFFINEVKETVL